MKEFLKWMQAGLAGIAASVIHALTSTGAVLSFETLYEAVIAAVLIRAAGWVTQKYGPSISVTSILLLLIPFTSSCRKADAAPLTMTVTGPMGMVAGDTLSYMISWKAPAVVSGISSAASSYTVTLSSASSNGTWTTVADSNLAAGKWTAGSGTGPMPTTINVTTTYVKSWISAIPWDSATFTASLVARNSAGASGSVATSWKVKHKVLPPGTPTPPTIDSSTTTTGTLVLPSTVGLALGGQRVACAFKQFSNGAVTEWTGDKAACDSIYTKYVPSAARALVTPAQQAHTDSMVKTCVTWTSSTPLAVNVAPNVPCSSAAVVNGLQVTLRNPGPLSPLLREAAYEYNSPPLIAMIRPWGRLGEHVIVDCLRAGSFWLQATTPTGSAALQEVHCVVRQRELLAIRETR